MNKGASKIFLGISPVNKTVLSIQVPPCSQSNAIPLVAQASHTPTFQSTRGRVTGSPLVSARAITAPEAPDGATFHRRAAARYTETECLSPKAFVPAHRGFPYLWIQFAGSIRTHMTSGTFSGRTHAHTGKTRSAPFFPRAR